MGNKTSRPLLKHSSSSSVINSSNSWRNWWTRIIMWPVIIISCINGNKGADNNQLIDQDYNETVLPETDTDSSADGEALLKLFEDDDDDETAGLGAELLAAASEAGRGDLALQILEACPDLIQIRDPAGDTILHLAARFGHVDTLKKLLNHFVASRRWGLKRSMLVSGNGHGDTPLHLAVKYGHEEAAQVLVFNHKEGLHQKNHDGFTPRDLARKAGYVFWVPCALLVDMEQKLLRLDLEGEDNSTEFFKLLLAIEKGHKNIALTILGANPSLLRRQLGGTKGTALHMAARHGHVEILRDMIGLIIMSRSNNGDLTKTLLVDGNKYGDTPLHVAIKGAHQKAALELIQAAPKGAYLVNNKGVSPLYLAVKAGYVEIVRYMFKVKPIATLSRSRQQAVLENKEASLVNASVDSTSLGVLQVILEHLPSLIDSIDEKGWKPLSYAAYKGNSIGVCYLLENFPNSARKCDKDGSFPVHKAVGGGHISVVKEFISRCPQAMFDIDRKQRSILHIAVCSAKANVLSYLTKKTEVGKKLFNLKDHNGKTFMDLAKELKL